MGKKLVAFLCAFLFLLPLSACRNEEEEDTNKITIYKIEAIENKELTEPEETEPELTEPTEPTEPEVPETRPATEPVFRGPGAEDAMEYIHSLYQDDGKQTRSDFERYAYVRVGGVEFNVQWSVDVNKTLVEIVPGEDGTVTIDVSEECQEDTPYVLTATITDADGNVATYSWNYILPKAQDADEIMKAAYALKDGESLPYESRLTGKIISLDTVWNAEFNNVTVTIEIEGAAGMPIKCYRMKPNEDTAESIKALQVGNIIRVYGTLKNYQGTIEFDAGCILEKVEKGDAVDAPTDPGEILKQAYALGQDEVLPYQATLTGTVTDIETPYDAQYGNISVVIQVEGYPQYPILCYRLKGTGVDQIAEGDLITVTGIIKNYKGTIEYDSGCIMTERVSGGGVAKLESSDAAQILADASKLGQGDKLDYYANLTGKVVDIDTPYDSQYKNISVVIQVNGVQILCYRLKSGGADVSKIKVGDIITVRGVIENYMGEIGFSSGSTLEKSVSK